MATGGGWSPWMRAGCVMFLRVSSVWDRNDLQAQRSAHIIVSSAFITLLESQRSEVTPADSQLIVSSSQDTFRWIWRIFDWINWILLDERLKWTRDIRDELILVLHQLTPSLFCDKKRCFCTNNCSWISWSRRATSLQQDPMKRSQFWSQFGQIL